MVGGRSDPNHPAAGHFSRGAHHHTGISVRSADQPRADLPSGRLWSLLAWPYGVDIDGEESTAVRVARFTGPSVSIYVDGKRAGLLIHEPYALELNKLSPGKHKVDVTMYGNRYNAFGELHLVPGKTNWIGADMWRTEFVSPFVVIS